MICLVWRIFDRDFSILDFYSNSEVKWMSKKWMPNHNLFLPSGRPIQSIKLRIIRSCENMAFSDFRANVIKIGICIFLTLSENSLFFSQYLIHENNFRHADEAPGASLFQCKKPLLPNLSCQISNKLNRFPQNLLRSGNKKFITPDFRVRNIQNR